MKNMRDISVWAIALVAVVISQGCVSGAQLRTVPAAPHEISGKYNLLLYGCHYPDDIKNVAILVDENSKYPVEIYDIKTSYRIEKEVPAREALNVAENFVRCSTRRVSQTQMRKIIDDEENTVGFEIRPLYFPLEFGINDVMLINYALKNGTVNAYIRLDADVEKKLESLNDDKQDTINK